MDSAELRGKVYEKLKTFSAHFRLYVMERVTDFESDFATIPRQIKGRQGGDDRSDDSAILIYV